IRVIYNDWMAEEVKTLTPTVAWEAIDPQLIQHSFKYCGISVVMDRLKENLIFDYDRVEITKLRTSNYIYDNDEGGDDEGDDDGDNEDDDDGDNKGDDDGDNEDDNDGNDKGGNDNDKGGDDNFEEGSSTQKEKMINIEFLEPYIETENLEEFESYYTSQEM
ncbi:4633_t:CDS:2, partial [Ambispora gerdemannii]